jgi:type IV fimbrial biogenesis protein FimT
MLNRNQQRGVTLIEVMTTVAIISITLSLGIPAYTEWLQNTQIRTAAESMQAGIQLARAEGLKRNGAVRFQLMTTTDANCALSASGANWVISVNDASGQCQQTNAAAAPFITRLKAGSEGTRNVTVQASQASIAFSGLGLVTPAVADTITIDIENPTGGACVADGGKMRCLRLQVSNGGQVRMCDPSVAADDDPRMC